MKPVRTAAPFARLFPALPAGLLLLAACSGGGQATESEEPPPLVLGEEEVAVVERRELVGGPVLTGTLHPGRQAMIRAQVGGQMLAVPAREGQRVGAGEVLALLDPSAIEEARASAAAAVDTARRSLELARRELERQRSLAAAGAVAERDVETARQEVAAAEARLAEARSRLASSGKQLADTRVRAPFAGTVSERTVGSGDVVQPGTELFTLVDLSTLELQASVASDYLPELQPGVPLTFEVGDGRDALFRGRVTRINPAVDPVTREARIYAEVPNPERALAAGIFVRGRVETRSAEALSLPDDAIDRSGRRPAVMRIRPFALTIACAVLVSLFVSFSLDPMLSAYWPDPQIEQHERRNALSRALDRFNRWFDRKADDYTRVIAWALDHRLTVLAIVLVVFFGAIALQVAFGGAGFVPESDRSEINLSFETAPGSNLDYTALKARQLDERIRGDETVDSTYATVGGTEGSGSVDAGSLYVKLMPKDERDLTQAEVSRRLRGEARRLGAVTAYLSEGGPGGGGQRQIQLQLRGDDLDALNRAAERLESAVREVPGAVDVGLSTRGHRPELRIDVDRKLAATLGLSVAQVAQSLRPAFAGVDAGDWVDPLGKTRDVTVRLAPEARSRLEDIRRLPLAAPAGPVLAAAGSDGETGAAAPQLVPLGQIAEVHHDRGPAQIDHLDRERVITVGANVQGRAPSEVSGAIQQRIRSLELPPGVELSQGGQVEEQGEVFGRIFGALGLALMLMYFILVVQFGSFLDPLVILFSLPLSLVGVVLMLLLTGDTLNIMSLIGVILLMGIVAKNAILLIDFAKWNHEEGMPLREALIEAGRVRLRPILMTTAALVARMVPVALGLGEGADFRAPLGRAVIGGTLTSTLLTLLVIPTVYDIVVELRDKLRRLLPERPGTAVAEHGSAGAR